MKSSVGIRYQGGYMRKFLILIVLFASTSYAKVEVRGGKFWFNDVRQWGYGKD
jgi:hypothetical protein